MKVKCKECGKEFQKHANAIRRTRNNFCSRSCAGKYNGRKRQGPYKNRGLLYQRARQLRLEGYGYRTIGKMVNVNFHTVIGWVQGISIDPVRAHRLACRKRRRPLEQLTSNSAIRHRLIEERGHKCEGCKLATWEGQLIALEIHHKDGNTANNGRDNLELLCPNCHSQTPNYRNRKRSHKAP